MRLGGRCCGTRILPLFVSSFFSSCWFRSFSFCVVRVDRRRTISYYLYFIPMSVNYVLYVPCIKSVAVGRRARTGAYLSLMFCLEGICTITFAAKAPLLRCFCVIWTPHARALVRCTLPTHGGACSVPSWYVRGTIADTRACGTVGCTRWGRSTFHGPGSWK